jgi:hypothetical protein
MDPLEPELADVFSPVPDVASDASSAMFAMMLPVVRDGADLVRFHAIDAWIKTQAEQRKAQNKKLMEIEAAWDARKAELKHDLEELAKRGEGGTMLGTTYLRDREDSVTWTSDTELINELELMDLGFSPDEYEITYHLNAKGRANAKAAMLDRAKAGLDIPHCVTITPGGKSVCTRLKGRQAIDTRKLLALRNDALRSLSNQDSNDSKESHD